MNDKRDLLEIAKFFFVLAKAYYTGMKADTAA